MSGDNATGEPPQEVHADEGEDDGGDRFRGIGGDVGEKGGAGGGADSPGHPEGEDDPPVDVAEPPVAQPGGEGGTNFGGVDDRGCLGWPHGEQQDGGGCDAEAHADAAID